LNASPVVPPRGGSNVDKPVNGKPDSPDRRDTGELALEGPRPPAFRATYVLEGTLSRGHDFWKRIRGRISFWTVVFGATIVSAIYLFVFAESMYVSEAMISLENRSAVSTGVSSILGSALGTSSTTNEDAALVAYIQSHEMLATLDKKFHLREIYSDYRHNPFWRLAKDASDEDFLLFYQGMVEVDLEHDVSIITLHMLDYDAVRSKAIADAILTESEKFMNRMSDAMREATLRAARVELQEATTQVATAPASAREVAELRLQSAQAAMATALSLANQQQVFVVRISNPTLPSITTRPQRLLDLAAIALGAAVFYAISILILSNIRDHRPI
jgi:capsule polysaccharide export protein KpsE/RkpR